MLGVFLRCFLDKQPLLLLLPKSITFSPTSGVVHGSVKKFSRFARIPHLYLPVFRILPHNPKNENPNRRIALAQLAADVPRHDSPAIFGGTLEPELCGGFLMPDRSPAARGGDGTFEFSHQYIAFSRLGRVARDEDNLLNRVELLVIKNRSAGVLSK